MDFSNYIFQYGKSYEDSNVYIFEDDKKNCLYISEKIGKFTEGSCSRYLLFEYNIADTIVKEYIDKKSSEYKNSTNIRPIIDNIDGCVVTCTKCKTIVHKNDITSARGDSCIFCDVYMCKSCKKLYPLARLKDRICDNCRAKVDEHK